MRGTLRAVNAGLGLMLLLVGLTLAAGTQQAGWLAVAVIGGAMVAADLIAEGRR